MSAPSAQRVAGGRWAVKYVYIRIVKSRRKLDSPQLASLRPGTCYVVREGISNIPHAVTPTVLMLVTCCMAS